MTLKGVITQDRYGTQVVHTNSVSSHLKVIHLSGSRRAQAEVGDSVTLEHRTTRSSGLWYGVKEDFVVTTQDFSEDQVLLLRFRRSLLDMDEEYLRDTLLELGASQDGTKQEMVDRILTLVPEIREVIPGDPCGLSI